MRTLTLGIVGIFALGLAVGSFVAATTTGESESAFSPLPPVDCGAGREALVEQVIDDGEGRVRVKCVATEPAGVVTATPSPAPPPSPVVTSQPVPEPHTEAKEIDGSSRSLKDSALIIGGAAGAGAGIGAIAKGKKGAAVGAAAGAVAGTVYDLATRKKK